MKSVKNIILSGFLVTSAVVLTGSEKQDEKPSKERVESYLQAKKSAHTDHILSIHRLVQTREENGIINEENKFLNLIKQIEMDFSDVVNLSKK